MKALSIRQPWAALVALGEKDVENRSKPTSYRGPVLIHAPAKPDREAMNAFIADLQADGVEASEDDFVFGAIIGRAVLVDCVTAHPSEWFEGPYGWVFEQAELFDEAVQEKGALGLWECTWPK